MLLHTYQKRYGLQTIRQMISRYAPPSENDTELYINNVSARSGIGPDVRISTLTRDTMIPIVTAMSRQEVGMADSVAIEEGWRLFVAK